MTVPILRFARVLTGPLFGLLVIGGCTEFTSNGDGSEAGAAGSAGSSSAGSGGSPLPSAGNAGEANTAGATSGGNGGSPAGGAAGSTSVAGSGGSAPSDCPCAAPTPTCQAGKCVVRGPTMVKAGSFYIDRTEVTRGQYNDFLKAKGDDTSGQATECAWNDNFAPGTSSGETMTVNRPVTFVDFCDAAAFCAWADKQLCGKIGGGELLVSETPDPTKGQWIAACGGPDGHRFPYGKEYRSGACNVGDGAPPARLLDVGSSPGCAGHYPNLVDMLGNAQEWIDVCDAHNGKLDGCERIGGSYMGGQACSQSGLAERRLQAAELGFRCCSK